jgi:hypothetical protein
MGTVCVLDVLRCALYFDEQPLIGVIINELLPSLFTSDHITPRHRDMVAAWLLLNAQPHMNSTCDHTIFLEALVQRIRTHGMGHVLLHYLHDFSVETWKLYLNSGGPDCWVDAPHIYLFGMLFPDEAMPLFTADHKLLSGGVPYSFDNMSTGMECFRDNDSFNVFSSLSQKLADYMHDNHSYGKKRPMLLNLGPVQYLWLLLNEYGPKVYAEGVPDWLLELVTRLFENAKSGLGLSIFEVRSLLDIGVEKTPTLYVLLDSNIRHTMKGGSAYSIEDEELSIRDWVQAVSITMSGVINLAKHGTILPSQGKKAKIVCFK